MRHYPYRTTLDKLEHAHADVRESGDVVLSTHFLGGRDWVLLCRAGEPTVADLTADELGDVIETAVVKALRQVNAKTLSQAVRDGVRDGAHSGSRGR